LFESAEQHMLNSSTKCKSKKSYKQCGVFLDLAKVFDYNLHCKTRDCLVYLCHNTLH